MTESICLVKDDQEPQKVYQGYIEKCFRGTETYAAFYGIPYAAPPDGTKLYQAPEPLNSTGTNNEDQNYSTPQSPSAAPGTSTWSLAAPNPFMSSTLARHFVKKQCCIQSPDFDKGSADCLYLNVFCPRDPKFTNELLPVLVFIHGGGFDTGSNDPDEFSPEKIVQFDVVFVTINYRLGVYGFLNLRTKEVPGNAGLKDQVEALRWIRDNIAHFKGDPENVTLSGWSAGATCVNCHLISPMSKGLFHKAIVQCGGIFWPYGYRGHRFEQIEIILADAECRSSLHDKKKSKEVPKLVHNLLMEKRDSRHPASFSPLYGPTSEKEEKGAFLTGDIESLMEQVQPSIPVMAGIVTSEALDTFKDPDYDWRKLMKTNQIFRRILMDGFRWSEVTAIKNTYKIRRKYFPAESYRSEEAMYCSVANFFHDTIVHHFYDCFKFGPKRILPKKFYVYRFEHVSEISVGNNYTKWHLLKAAAHGDDVRYLYTPTEVKLESEASIYEGGSQNKDILRVINRMCSLWANFCKNGTPESKFDSKIKWKPYSVEEPYYLSIDSKLVLKEGSVLSDKCIWLNELVNSQPTIPSQRNTPERE